MKKLFITLSLVAVSLSMASCEYLKKLEEKLAKGETAEVAEPAGQNVGTTAQVANPNEVRVYSNAYDGFVNVRSQPSAKSAILGRLKNGQDYLVQLGVQGKWIIVQWHNTIGYVNSSVVGYTPWKPVYLGVDGDWIQGAYECCVSVGDWGLDLLVFSNGKFAIAEGAYYQLAYGTWKFEGSDIVITVKKDLQGYFSYGEERRYSVDVNNSTINGCHKNTYYSGFATVKKTVNQSVKLK